MRSLTHVERVPILVCIIAHTGGMYTSGCALLVLLLLAD